MNLIDRLVLKGVFVRVPETSTDIDWNPRIRRFLWRTMAISTVVGVLSSLLGLILGWSA